MNFKTGKCYVNISSEKVLEADLIVGLLEPLPVGGLELEGHVLLPGLDELLVARGHDLGLFLLSDGGLAPGK